MFYHAIAIIFQAIGAAANWVAQLFRSCGVGWIAVVGGGAVLSLFLRLFVRVFIGDRLYAAAGERAGVRNSYDIYKNGRERNAAYDARYKKETALPRSRYR